MFKPGDKVRWYGNKNPTEREKVYTIKNINHFNLKLVEYEYSISSLEEDEEGNLVKVGNWEDYFCYAEPPRPIEDFL